MKKIISIILTVAVAVASLSMTAFAEGTRQHIVFDEYGNEFVINEDEVLVVIYDENEEIVSTYKQNVHPYTTHVDGTQYVIPKNGSAVTLSYIPGHYFYAGFCFTHPSYNSNATTRNRSVTVTIQNASAPQNVPKRNITQKTFSTNAEDNWGDSNYVDRDGKSYVGIRTDSISPYYGYYNAKYENESSNSLTIALIVTLD